MLEPGADPHVLFDERQNGRWFPRAILVDSEGDPIERILASKQNFDIDKIIYESEGTGGICVDGYYCKRDLSDAVEDNLRRTIEHCDKLDLIVNVTALTGGTAGLADQIIQRSSTNYSKIEMAVVGLFPSSKMADCVV